MSKLRLFENTYNKLVSDKAFIAYYLEQLMLRENKTREDLMALLNCNEETYYKLALCNAPQIKTADFTARILNIAAYTNVSEIILSNIIAPANEEIIDNKLLQAWKNLEQIFTLPAWFNRSQGKIYKTAFAAFILLLLIISYTPQNCETKNLQAFIGNHYSYTDTKKYSQPQDNTYVCIIYFKKSKKPVELFI